MIGLTKPGLTFVMQTGPKSPDLGNLNVGMYGDIHSTSTVGYISASGCIVHVHLYGHDCTVSAFLCCKGESTTLQS